jgi:hypothetical protein
MEGADDDHLAVGLNASDALRVCIDGGLPGGASVRANAACRSTHCI